jgi:hypothetical protein
MGKAFLPFLSPACPLCAKRAERRLQVIIGYRRDNLAERYPIFPVVPAFGDFQGITVAVQLEVHGGASFT